MYRVNKNNRMDNRVDKYIRQKIHIMNKIIYKMEINKMQNKIKIQNKYKMWKLKVMLKITIIKLKIRIKIKKRK